MSQITWNTDVNAPCCPGEILSDDGRSLLIQTDWDYPGTASTFGWSIKSVQRCRKCKRVAEMDSDAPLFVCHKGDDCADVTQRRCDHRGTDGTVDCKECGLKAGDFISAAGDWLNDNNGATADEPGYFSE